MIAYLVIREGTKWSDVFRLVPGESITIGRLPTCPISVKDERCSRNHAEVFFSSEQWTLRDLDSRNGTYVDGQRVQGDRTLHPGDIIQIGNSHLAFVDDLSKAFPDSSALLRQAQDVEHATKSDQIDNDAESVLEANEPAKITHRTGQTRFLEPIYGEQTDAGDVPKVGRAAAQLCRLAFALAKAPDVITVADLALQWLFEGTPIDTAAVLLMPRDGQDDPTAGELEIIASRSDTDYAYHRVSSFLTNTVLREGEGILARNVLDDSTFGNRDSQGELHTTSVICAPIRHSGRPRGLIHAYTTDTELIAEPDDLEFALAVADSLGVAMENLSRRQELAENLNQIRGENEQLRERLAAESELVGAGTAMERIKQEISRAAPSHATVLIRGESGVGKELVARAVHFSSPRRTGPFVCLNCAALAESLLESELFGHEKGAFTGATERKIGKFEAAHKGTLMLDEIGEMSSQIQAKFLRVLEGHPFERVGGSSAITVDVRVIAATNRDLEKEVTEGRFRRDLYFRLRVLEIVVAALRKRREDIPALAEHFLNRFNAETGRRLQGYSPRAMEEMMRYRWPGNIRELKNVVERAVVLARGEFIDVDDLALTRLSTAGDTEEGDTEPSAGYRRRSLAEIEQEHILATLESTGWNKSQAAGILGIERSTLDRKIKRYGLVRGEARFRP